MKLFKKGSEDGEGKKGKKSGSSVQNLYRIFISLIVLGILAFGLLKAYSSFTGFDPLKMDPQALAKQLIASESTYEFITTILSLAPQDSLQKTKQILGQEPEELIEDSSDSNTGKDPLFSFAVIADSHKDTGNLQDALNQSKEMGVKFVVGIGDLSDVGTIDELRDSKLQLDTNGLPYYVTPGDHDLWESREKKLGPHQNFSSIFGPPYQSFSYSNTRIILFYNSDNYLGLDGLQLKWIEDELDKLQESDAKLVFAIGAVPLYHPSSDHVMGKVEPKLKDQADHLIDQFSKKGVDEVITADTHFYSRYSEPKTGLKMTTAGAVTSVRNPQSPRFAVVDVYEDGSYNISEVEVE